MKTGRVLWAVKSGEGPTNDHYDVHVSTDKPTFQDDMFGVGWGCDHHIVDLCYRDFRRYTGLTLRKDKPVRVRFGAEIVEDDR